ncbi:MAG: sulfatase-like hydrolase/transferase [Planctomycetes bacterium]|nr:sulfatase-like hydrolase/transferase [Planctomycetota bacterium]
MRKRGFKYISVLLICMSLQAIFAEKPNVIFFITDDQPKELFNFTKEGRDQNLCPNIDKLWKEGVILEQHHVSSPVCTPSRFSCLTGAYASRSKCSWLTGPLKEEGQTAVQWNSFIVPENDTVAKVFRKNGYRTGAVGKNHVVFCEGIEKIKPKHNDDPRDPEVVAKLKKITDMLKVEYDKAGFDFAENIYHNNPYYIGPLELAVHNQEWVTEAALDFIDGADEDPFFLYFATTLPHSPEGKDRSWGADGRYTPEGIVEKEPVGGHPSRDSLEKRIADAGLKGGSKREALLWIDDALGALLKKCEQENKLENTIIVFLSDHEMGAKGTVYQGGAHTTAFIWKHGGFKAGSRISSFTSNVDFAPTILDLAEISERPSPCDGISFAPELSGIKGLERDALYFEIGYARGVRIGDYKYVTLRYSEKAQNMPRAERQKRLDDFNLVMRNQGKEVHNEDPMTPFSHMILIPGGSNADYGAIKNYPAYYESDQLYYLADDPNEQVNLADRPEYKSVLLRMQKALTEELERLPGNYPGFVKR